MGFLGNLSNRVKKFLSRDKEAQAKRLAKGATSAGALTGYGKDMMQVFGYDSISAYLNIENDLLARFADYEEMDDSPEMSMAVSVIAWEATQNDYERKTSLWITSPDKTTELMLDQELIRKRLRLPEEELPEITRTLIKYGNDYEELLVDNEGVRGLNFLPPATVRRIEGPRGELYGFVQDYRGRYGYTPHDFQALIKRRFQTNKDPNNKTPGDWMRPSKQKAIALEDWEVVHFRLRGKQRRSIYGHSAMEGARWIWKRTQLLEDSAMIYRLQRAPERFAFYVDTGDLPPAEAMAMVNRVRQQYKKKKFFDPSTGKLNLRWEPLSQDDDFWVPVRMGQEGTRIEVLGSPAWQHMEDIEYFRDKMFSAMIVPKAYLAQDANIARQILSNQDVAFARMILSVQRELRNGISRIARIHLASLGIDPQRVEYEVHMAMPSSIYELAQIEVMNARADLAARMKEFVSEYWILHHIFRLEDEDIEMIMKQKEQDAERLAGMDSRQQIIQAKALQAAGLMPDQNWSTGVPMAPVQPASASKSNGQATPREDIDGMVRRVADGFMLPQYFTPRATASSQILSSRYQPSRWESSVGHGDRLAEKRAEGKIDKLLANDHHMTQQLERLGSLLQEIKRTARSGRNVGGYRGE